MKIRVLLISVGLLLIVGGFLVWTQTSWLQRLLAGDINQSAKAPPKRPPATVAVRAVESRSVTPRQIIVGSIKPRRLSQVGSAASGRVEAFLVNEGEAVTKGQAIAQLRTKTIQAQLDAATATFEAKKYEYQKLKNSVDEEILQAKAKLNKNKFLVKFLTAKRQRSLRALQAVSEEDREEIASLEEQAKASQAELEANVKLLIKTKAARLDVAKAMANAAEAEKRLLKEQLDRHTIAAPFDGYVILEHTETGQWVLQGGLVATIAEMAHVEIEVPVLEDYISYLQLGTAVTVEVPALPRGRRVFQGKIAHIVQQANPKTQTFPVKVWVKNEPMSPNDPTSLPLLKGEMLARVQLPAGPTTAKALLVPRDAVNLEGDRRSVFVIVGDGNTSKGHTVREITVELGVAEGDYVEILGAVQEGQLVVVEGNERLRQGQPVQIIKN